MENQLFNTIKLNGETSKIYQAIFYLNPGDYHRYHSPASLLVKRSNHIVGYLAPVKESYISTHEVIQKFYWEINFDVEIKKLFREFTKEMKELRYLGNGNMVH